MAAKACRKVWLLAIISLTAVAALFFIANTPRTNGENTTSISEENDKQGHALLGIRNDTGHRNIQFGFGVEVWRQIWFQK